LKHYDHADFLSESRTIGMLSNFYNGIAPKIMLLSFKLFLSAIRNNKMAVMYIYF